MYTYRELYPKIEYSTAKLAATALNETRRAIKVDPTNFKYKMLKYTGELFTQRTYTYCTPLPNNSSGNNRKRNNNGWPATVSPTILHVNLVNVYYDCNWTLSKEKTVVNQIQAMIHVSTISSCW